MHTSAILWVPLSIFFVITLTFLAKYSFDRRHYKNASRRAVAAANNIENTNTTVVYTIPTTGQLNSAYPELQRQMSNGRPPPYVSSGESPPSYDQAVSIPIDQPRGNMVIK
ncbi:uncharacterized protein LOC119081542 isoform X2 [Bradysia coprophila]|uniref:uncharacterized protein LOC119081542 isoform X2 n=1 Tax=Bradysia coprophila TaxID=38358 RepID=UPI00187DD4E3|nr:uncharacterized protein LOC119081542 isoform X2 [Bradysia coprophila]